MVTGAGSGIGRALTDALVEAGAHVIATDVDGERLNTMTSTSVSTSVLDVTDPIAFQAVVQAGVDAHGRVDALFNNAGIGHAGEVQDTDLATWQRTIDVNLWGVIHGIRSVYPHMIQRRSGVIVNTSSGAGLCPRPGMVPYATAKHAVVGLSTSLRAECAAYGISVHVACPGYIATDIMNATVYSGVDGDRLQSSIPIRAMPASTCALLILDGVRRGRTLIPVSGATQAEWLLYRAMPSIIQRAATLRARTFRAHRDPSADGPDDTSQTGGS